MTRWIRIQVDIQEHAVFAPEPFTEREAWQWMIGRAAWKETAHRVGASVHRVPVGSFFATVREMQTAWKWTSTRRVSQFLSLLSSQNMIETCSETGKTLVTVCNYTKYQSAETPSETPERPEAKQERNTKDTNTPVTSNTSSLRSDVAAPAPRKRAHRMPDDFSPDLDFAVSEGMTLSQAKSEAEAMRDWSKSSPKGAKLDWPATWRGWVRRAMKDRPRQQSQAPPMTRHQQRHQTALDACDRILGARRDDEFTGNTLDLERGDYRSH